jgi:quercetin dioxygenase-like cupin family protein
MRNRSRAAILLVTVAVGGLLAASAFATLPVGFTATILGSGDTDHAVHLDGDGVHLDSDGPVNVTTGDFRLAVGGKTGWHHHPGVVLVIVQGGTIRETHVGPNGGCISHTYSDGDVFAEGSHRAHIARNIGTTEVSLLATFIVPTGTPSLRIDRRVPECAK